MTVPSILAMRTSAFLSNEAEQFIVGDVLDVGCGAMPYKRLFPNTSWKGLDARPVGDIVADMDTHLESENYDTVLCTDSLQFSRDPKQAITNMASAVKRGGHLIIAAPNVAAEDQMSRWRFTVGGLGEMVQLAGLEIGYLDGLTGLFEDAASDFANSFGISTALPAQFKGWIAHLDRTYPMLSACIARKP